MNIASSFKSEKWVLLSGLALAISALVVGCQSDSDSSSNTSSNTSPTLSLKSQAATKVKQGDTTYQPPEAIALDQEDGDLSEHIVVSGDSVDVHTPNTYRLRFSVQDSDNNLSKLVHTVRVADFGARDSNFGTNGLLKVPRTIFGYSLSQGTNGDMFVAGTSETYSMSLSKYNSSGIADTGFDSDGQVISDLADSSGMASHVDANGAIYVAGDYGGRSPEQIAVWKYQPDGQLDTRFGLDGVRFYEFPHHTWPSTNDMVMDDEGALYLTGEQHSLDGSNLFVLKLKSNGDVDATFGSAGLVVFNSRQNERGEAIALDSEQNLYVAGYSGGAGALWKLDNTGQPVNDFGRSGQVTFSQKDSNARFSDLAIDDNNAIYVTGDLYVGGVGDEMLLLKYDSQGNLAQDFGQQGVVAFNSDVVAVDGLEESKGSAIKVAQDGTLYIAGDINHNESIAVWHYDTKGQLMPHFGDQGLVIYPLDISFSEYARDILVDEDGHAIYVTGNTGSVKSGDRQGFVLKLIN
ncbi:MAG: immunoglobulin-like domain-containing protein [Hydrogenovibrio sp.]